MQNKTNQSRSTQPRFSIRIAAFAIALFTSVVLVTATSHATPFDQKTIPAKADVVGHLDLDKLRASNVWPIVVEQLPAEVRKGTKKTDIAKLLQAINGDDEKAMMTVAGAFLANCRSITVWSDSKENSAVVANYPSASAIAIALSTMKSVKTSKKAGTTVFHLGDDGLAAVSGDNIVIAEKMGPLVATMKTLAGTARSLPKAKISRLNASTGKGVFFVAGFGGKLLKDLKKQAASAAMRADIQSVLVLAGEQSGGLFAELEAQVASAEEAKNVESVISGLISLGTLGNDDPDLAEILRGISVKAKGSILSVRLNVPKKMLKKFLAQID